VLIEGRLKLDQWEDKETKAKRSKHVVVVDSFHFVDSKPEVVKATSAPPVPHPRPPAAAARPRRSGGQGPMGEEDIPF